MSHPRDVGIAWETAWEKLGEPWLAIDPLSVAQTPARDS